jgi:nucleotide-binding universal stress UspA family protein
MGKIVVGYDGSVASTEAVNWALARALSIRSELTVVHAWSYPYTGWRTGVTEPRNLMELDAAKLLEIEMHRLRSHAPGAHLKACLIEDAPFPALMKAADGADMLVIGSKGHGGFIAHILGSVSHKMCHEAKCPVAVIRHDAHLSGGGAGAIVVGVDGSTGSLTALKWAMAEGGRSNTPVAAVAAWSYPIAAFMGVDVPVYPLADQAADTLSHLDSVIIAAGAAGRVTAEVIEGRAELVLGDRSALASMLVVGASSAFGAVATRVAAHAHCPVVVVPA